MVYFGLNLTFRSARSAVIPYIYKKVKGKYECVFLLGEDWKSGDITDFGGGVKKGETDLTGGFREFMEETEGIFKNHIGVNDMCTCIAATTNNLSVDNRYTGNTKGMSVIFVPICETWKQNACLLFHRTSKYTKSELKGLRWFSKHEFDILIRGKHKNYNMWSRLRKVYAELFTPELYNCLIARFKWSPLKSLNSEQLHVNDGNSHAKTYHQP